MSSSAINAQLFQAKIGSIQNQADSSAVYSAGVWSFKNSTALTSVTITDSGNVGIGTSSPTFNFGKGAMVNNAGAATLRLNNSTASVNAEISAYDASYGLVQYTLSNHPIVWGTNGVERMRIDASGNLLVGVASKLTGGIRGFDINTTGVGNSGISFGLEGSSKGFWYALSTGTQLRCESAPGYTVVIASGGSNGVSLANGASSWSPVSSDERKKKNFETTQGLSEVLQIEPVKYHFNSEEDSAAKRLGFKAQNLQAVIPEMVHPTGEKAEDGSDYLTITPDYILPVLVKAIQEQQAQIEALKAEVAALKAP